MGTARRILLVEDHRDTGKVLSRLLAGDGHIVSVAGTLQEARELGHENGFDLLLVDLLLPDGDGSALLAEPGELARIPAIALTASGFPEDRVRTRRAGFHEHLLKPLDIRALRAAIDRVAGPPSAPGCPSQRCVHRGAVTGRKYRRGDGRARGPWRGGSDCGTPPESSFEDLRQQADELRAATQALSERVRVQIQNAEQLAEGGELPAQKDAGGNPTCPQPCKS
jgi:CheY-like chemotaxis protein